MKWWFVVTLAYACYIIFVTHSLSQALTMCIILNLLGYLLKNSLGKARQCPVISFKEIDRMTGSDFEIFITALYQRLGYKAYRTPETGDFGADVIARKQKETLAIQCKRYRRAVGVSAVQEIVAALPVYHATHGIVITNNYFTPAAKKLAQANHIELIDRPILKKMIR